MPPQMPQTLAELYGGMPAYVEPLTPARALYNELLLRYGNVPAELAIQEADIVTEAKIGGNASEIIWFVKETQANPTNAIRSTEIRLETRDAFVFDRMGLSFALELTASTTPDTAVFHQWPNPALTAVGGLDAAVTAVIQAYNGSVTGEINSVTFMRKVHGARMIYADYAQRGTLIFTASNQAWNNQEGDRGFTSLTPCLDIKGTDTTQFRLKIPTVANFGALALNSVVARLTLRGLLIQGGAEFF